MPVELGLSVPFTNGPRFAFPDTGAAGPAVVTGAGAFGAGVQLIADTGNTDTYLSELAISNATATALQQVNVRFGLGPAPFTFLASFRIGIVTPHSTSFVACLPPLRIPAHSVVGVQAADLVGGSTIEVGIGYTVLS